MKTQTQATLAESEDNTHRWGHLVLPEDSRMTKRAWMGQKMPDRVPCAWFLRFASDVKSEATFAFITRGARVVRLWDRKNVLAQKVYPQDHRKTYSVTTPRFKGSFSFFLRAQMATKRQAATPKKSESDSKRKKTETTEMETTMETETEPEEQEVSVRITRGRHGSIEGMYGPNGEMMEISSGQRLQNVIMRITLGEDGVYRFRIDDGDNLPFWMETELHEDQMPKRKKSL